MKLPPTVQIYSTYYLQLEITDHYSSSSDFINKHNQMELMIVWEAERSKWSKFLVSQANLTGIETNLRHLCTSPVIECIYLCIKQFGAYRMFCECKLLVIVGGWFSTLLLILTSSAIYTLVCTIFLHKQWSANSTFVFIYEVL